MRRGGGRDLGGVKGRVNDKREIRMASGRVEVLVNGKPLMGNRREREESAWRGSDKCDAKLFYN